MKHTVMGGMGLMVLLILFSAPGAVEAGNCECYFSRDCPQPTKQYCNWKAKCTRNCELQIDWEEGWGQPPVSKADCDKWNGPCHDNEPQPPNGDDGDGENCEPSSAKNPDTNADIPFKMMDGMCANNPVPKPVGTAIQEIGEMVEYLINLANAGGGNVELVGDPYVVDIMTNVGQLALGIYDLSTPAADTLPLMGDIRDSPCGVETLQAFGDALQAEAQAISDMNAGGGTATEPMAISTQLDRLSVECRAWVQRRTHDCQYPHPPEHRHEFPFSDGIECISQQLAAMARSMNLDGTVPPDNTPPTEEPMGTEQK